MRGAVIPPVTRHGATSSLRLSNGNPKIRLQAGSFEGKPKLLQKAVMRVRMRAEHRRAGWLRQETVSSPRLPFGDQPPTARTAGAETVAEEEGQSGNTVFIFHWSWWSIAAGRPSCVFTSCELYNKS